MMFCTIKTRELSIIALGNIGRKAVALATRQKKPAVELELVAPSLTLIVQILVNMVTLKSLSMSC